MAQPTTTPKIEELRARLKADPKSRQFFPLAEELRKIDRHDEAEKVLREGLAVHPVYISAWISLGRVLHEAGRNKDAVEVLEKALTLDQGNVVAARLLAEAYLALDEKIEAIKKFKLVNALMPNDEEVEAQIDALDRELNPARYAAVAPAAAPAPAAVAPTPAAAVAEEPPPPSADDRQAVEAVEPSAVPEPQPVAAASPAEAEPALETGDVFSSSAASDSQAIVETAADDSSDVFTASEPPPIPRPRPSPEETFPFPPSPKFDSSPPEQESVWEEPAAPVESPPSESPFADLPPAPPVFQRTFEMDEPSEAAPAEPDSAAEEASPFSEESAAVVESEPEPPSEDPTATLTMADLYAKQGHYDRAREIVERLLERDPSNRALREKLQAIETAAQPAPVAFAGGERDQKARRLESWLSKVKKDGGRV